MNDESKMTIAVAVTFIILETAKFLIYEYWELDSSPVRLVRVINLTNNAVNFVIYSMFGKQFRQDVRKTFCPRWRMKIVKTCVTTTVQ
jgi:hypothetical protein